MSVMSPNGMKADCAMKKISVIVNRLSFRAYLKLQTSSGAKTIFCFGGD